MPKNGRELQLRGANRNIVLEQLALNRRLSSNIGPRLLDLIDIGTYVFAADRITSRGSPVAGGMGRSWYRHLHFNIAVRDPPHWSQPELVRQLKDLLGFMSDDDFEFEFVQSDVEAPPDDYFCFDENLAAKGTPAPVILFSGGLDSLAGTLQELQTGSHRVVLVSHQSSPIVTHYQNDLLQELHRDYRDRVLHLPVRMNLLGLRSLSNTQRTRTFFFSCIAGAVAAAISAPGIRYYENGIMSLNLPLSEEVVSTAATRSTHPRTLAEMALFLEVALGRMCTVDNPFILKTKAEVIGLFEPLGQSKKIDLAFTCTEVRRRVGGKSHCGACLQCLHRIFGALSAGMGQHDKPDKYQLDVFESPREGLDRTMIVNFVRRARQFQQMKDVEHFFKSYSLELSRLRGAPTLGSTEAAIQNLFELHQRFGNEVVGAIESGLDRYRDRLARGAMAHGSLLTLVVGDQTQSEPAGGAPTTKRAPFGTADAGPIRLMIDQARGCFSINGQPPLKWRRSVAVLVLLAEQYREDARAEVGTENYVPTAKLLTALGMEEDALAHRVERLRNRIAEALKATGHPADDRQAVIQSKKWHGYRLNPAVRLVAPR
jgi:7-cyano-7-deazaguanine synthase in queuosine biosynthesis